MVGVDWCDAYAYCSWAGKRLCGKLGGGGLTEYGYSRPDRSEWSLACTNYGTSDYPYGTEEDRTACAVGDLYAPVTLHPVGSLPSCEGGPTGVFDMVGNVQEWENATIYDNGVYILGGSYRRGYACDTYVETTVDIHGDDIGFRCCKDPE
jgi:formylglycine-generating enzyme required for sulfatase activity